MITLLFIAAIAWHSGQATSIGTAWHLKRYGASGLVYDKHAPIFATNHKAMLNGTIVEFRAHGKTARLMKYDSGMPKNHFDLSDKYVRYLCGNKNGCKVEYRIVSTKYACEGYKCLRKRFGKSLDGKEMEE